MANSGTVPGKLVRHILRSENYVDPATMTRTLGAECATRATMPDGGDTNTCGHGVELSLQQLCQTLGPLGKSIDFVHSDLARMTKELQCVRSQCREEEARLEKETLETRSLVKKATEKLDITREQISKEKQKIAALEAQVARNQARIDLILRFITNPEDTMPARPGLTRERVLP